MNITDKIKEIEDKYFKLAAMVSIIKRKMVEKNEVEELKKEIEKLKEDNKQQMRLIKRLLVGMKMDGRD